MLWVQRVPLCVFFLSTGKTAFLQGAWVVWIISGCVKGQVQILGQSRDEQVWCNKREDSMFDDWQMTSFKPYHSPFVLQISKSIRKAHAPSLGAGGKCKSTNPSLLRGTSPWPHLLATVKVKATGSFVHATHVSLHLPAVPRMLCHLSNKPFPIILVCVTSSVPASKPVLGGGWFHLQCGTQKACEFYNSLSLP